MVKNSKKGKDNRKNGYSVIENCYCHSIPDRWFLLFQYDIKKFYKSEPNRSENN